MPWSDSRDVQAGLHICALQAQKTGFLALRFLLSVDILINFFKRFFQGYHQNVKQFVWPDLVPYGLQRLTEEDTSS